MARADKDAVRRLREFELFAGCDDDDLRRLAGSSDVTSVPAGWPLIRESTPGDACYVILDGTAEVSQQGQAVATLGRGDVVGEAALAQRDLRNATVTASTPLELLHIDAAAFTTLVERSPQLRNALLQRLQR